MKHLLIFLLLVSIHSVSATTFVCEELPEERKVISDEKIIPYKTSSGYQYILQGPIDYQEYLFKSAVVLVGEIENPELIFFPSFETRDGIRDGIFYSGKILKDASLVISYGETCSGDGYELHFKLSETSNE